MAVNGVARSYWPAESLMPDGPVCAACGRGWVAGDGLAVRELRRFVGWSQRELASVVSASGVPCNLGDISRLERGMWHRLNRDRAAAAIAAMTEQVA